MRLASLRDGTRDGNLVVVSDDLKRCAPVGGAFATLQRALERARTAWPVIQDLASRLNLGQIAGRPFDFAACLAPLPRAYQWIDSTAYSNHLAVIRAANGLETRGEFWSDPPMDRGASDWFFAPQEAIALADENWGLDFEAGPAVIVDDVPMGVDAKSALNYVRLAVLASDLSLRHMRGDDATGGFGVFQAKPGTAFAPVAVSPGALGAGWQEGRLALSLFVSINGSAFARLRAEKDMTFDFGALIAAAAKTRPLAAGTVIGSGAVSNAVKGRPNRSFAQGGAGFASLIEQRCAEVIAGGVPATSYLLHGDTLRIDMRDTRDKSVFGVIEQSVAPERS